MNLESTTTRQPGSHVKPAETQRQRFETYALVMLPGVWHLAILPFYLRGHSIQAKVVLIASDEFRLRLLRSAYAIRDDIPVAHREIWGKIREPGCWWRGADGVSPSSRRRGNARSYFEACAQSRVASSPNADCGPHSRTTHLTDVVVDVVHRLTTDPARLSKGWLEGIGAEGVTDDSEYVELLGVDWWRRSAVADAFHRALTPLPLEPLPTPEAGDGRADLPAFGRRMLRGLGSHRAVGRCG